MNVSYFDLTNDLKCSVLSPTNCTALKKKKTTYFTKILLGNITSLSSEKFSPGSAFDSCWAHKITFQVFIMRGMDHA